MDRRSFLKGGMAAGIVVASGTGFAIVSGAPYVYSPVKVALPDVITLQEYAERILVGHFRNVPIYLVDDLDVA